MLLRKSAAALVPLITPDGQEHLPLTQLLIESYTSSHPKHKPPGAALIKSWERSLPTIVEALNERGLGAVEVMIEYSLPNMDGEVDVLLAGYHPTTDDLSYVLIELKQWRKCAVSSQNPVAVDPGYENGFKLHPVRQVQRYCEHFMHSYGLLRGEPQRLAGVALLHNAVDEQVRELFDLQVNDHGRLYTMDRLEQFRGFLVNRLAPRPGGQAAEVLRNAKETPPPASNEAFSRVGSPHPVFALQREQEIAFQEVHEAVRRADENPGRKKVVIIRGGPGSGKTAVAVELLRTLKQEKRKAVHASGSKAFTNNLREAAVEASVAVAPRSKTRAKKQAQQDYRFFDQFGTAEPGSVEILLCDEAHRIRRTSNGRYTPAAVKAAAGPQADELIRAAEVPVFLLDDWQSLRPDEVGTAEYLVERAEKCGCDSVVIDLPGMFRARGSIEFRRWVTQLLSLDTASPRPWLPDGRMEVKLADSPQELEDFLRKKMVEQQAHARITAGFCWDWKTPKDGELLLEVQIGDWHRAWNAKDGVNIPDVPNTSLWATDPRGFDQVGCIYTAQNFEFDWNGVIIGRDLVWQDGRFVVDRTETRDGELRKKHVDDDQVDRLVRNAYHVLLTRGRVGTIIYAEDESTRAALRELISGTVGRPLQKKAKAAD